MRDAKLNVFRQISAENQFFMPFKIAHLKSCNTDLKHVFNFFTACTKVSGVAFSISQATA